MQATNPCGVLVGAVEDGVQQPLTERSGDKRLSHLCARIIHQKNVFGCFRKFLETLQVWKMFL